VEEIKFITDKKGTLKNYSTSQSNHKAIGKKKKKGMQQWGGKTF